jgi:hypothetical protein
MSLQVGGAGVIAAAVQGTTNQQVTFTSSNEGVASVDGTGVVRGVAAGSARIDVTSVQDNRAKASVNVTVTAAPGITVSITPLQANVAVGNSVRLVASVAGTSNTAVTWETSSNAIATVSNIGLVTGVSPGSVAITARSVANPAVFATAGVVVAGAPTYTLTVPATASVERGQTTDVTVAISRSGGHTSPVSLHVDPTPIGVSATFVPAVLDAQTFTAKLHIVTTGEAVAQTFPLITTATDQANVEHVDTTMLTILPAGVSNTIPLSNGVVLSNQYGEQGSFTYYRITVPTGTNSLIIATSGGDGDADLLVRHGDFPTAATNDCISRDVGNADMCTFDTPAPGEWFIALYGYLEYNGLSIVATTGSLVPGFTISGSPQTITLARGNTTNLTINATRTGGFTDDIAVSLEGFPAGIVAPPAGVGKGTLDATIAVTALQSAPLGTFNVTLRGHAPGLADRLVTLQLRITQ